MNENQKAEDFQTYLAKRLKSVKFRKYYNKYMNKEQNHEKEEWGGWKIVSDMLDNPVEEGTYYSVPKDRYCVVINYPTSKCYQELYEFVVAQKEKARQQERKRIKSIVQKEIAKSNKCNIAPLQRIMNEIIKLK